MIKIMLFSKKDVNNIASFLENKGTFKVAYKFESIANNLDVIKSQIIRLDKLIYICNGSSTEVRDDMQALYKIIQNTAFFSTDEILFLQQDSSDPMLSQYFQTIIQKSNIKNSAVRNVGKEFSFDNIYRALLGSSIDVSAENVINKVYKEEKNASASQAYSYLDEHDSSLEPFSMDHLDSYKTRKSNIVDLYSENIIESSLLSRASFDNINLNIDIQDSSVTKFVLISGEAKSGKSIWSSVLAASAFSDDMKVLIVDYTENGDIGSIINYAGLPFNAYDFSDLNNVLELGPSGLSTFVINRDLALATIMKLYSNSTNFDFVFFLCESDDFLKLSVLQIFFKQIYITFLYTKDIERCMEKISVLKNPLVIIADHSYQFNSNDQNYLKSQLNGIPLLKATHFTSIITNSDLYKKVLGIQND